jgi:phytanoyl-CoA hydroxylase
MNTFLTEAELMQFHDQGYLVRPAMIPEDYCTHLHTVVEQQLQDVIQPVEFEVDVQYPGAPVTVEEEGGRTIRRLLGAYRRHPLFKELATLDTTTQILKALFNQPAIKLSQAHHNCIMTKHPRYSSITYWHQDNRYWSFEQENLISVWTALGHETRDNGCLRVIPGSHRLNIRSNQLDEKLFLIKDLEQNKALIDSHISVELKPGDMLFFHSKLFHAASQNNTDQVKYSLVYTYHETSNRPVKNTRSASLPSIMIA